MAAYADTTKALLNIAGDDKEAVEQALDSGAFDIDTAFSRGGYAVPVDPTTLADLDTRKRLTAKLAEVNRAKAAFVLSSGTSRGRKGQSNVIQKDWAACNKWLVAVGERDVIIPGLPAAVDSSGLAGGGVTGFAVAGPATFDQVAIQNIHDLESFLALSGSGVHI